MSAFLWAMVTAGIWGIVPLMEKIGVRNASPPGAVMVRSLGVVIGFLLCSGVWSPWATLRTIGWRSALLLAGGGLIASFIGQMAFYRALQAGPISQVTPVAGAYPLVAALLGWWVLREPLTLPRVAGMMCVIVGVLLLRK